ncbi:MAG: hypothetical protein QMD92_07220 [bacterium]|nr:hypothetical protein [bacterium]
MLKEIEQIKIKLKELEKYKSEPEIAKKLVKEIKRGLNRIEKEARIQENRLEHEVLNKLKDKKKGHFTKRYILQMFQNQPKDKLNKIIQRLVKTRKLEKIGRGIYSMDGVGEEPRMHISESMEKIKQVLKEQGVKFMITGPDIVQEYINLIPKRMFHLIYVARGSGEWAHEIIEKKIGKKGLINPSEREIRNLLFHYNEDIIIIREVGETSIEYQNEGIATIEKAIVDLYFETTRKRIPFDNTELAEILQNILMRTRIDYSRLLRAATRRNIYSEIILILRTLNIHIAEIDMLRPIKESKAREIIKYFR